MRDTVGISVCIPNFNYAHFIGKSIDSVLAQEGDDFELIVVDNSSTDGSVEVISEYLSDPRVRLQVNPVNVGFAGNLDRVGALAAKDYMVLLSSDDVMESGALRAYSRLLSHATNDGSHVVVGSDVNVVDDEDRPMQEMRRDTRLWDSAELDRELSESIGHSVYVMDARELLRNSLQLMRIPFWFASTCYARQAYEEVGGYGGSQGINPDKGFAWKALSVSARAYHIEYPYFSYRVHSGGQGNLQARQDALKFLSDEYRYTYDIPEFVLASAGVSRRELSDAFLYEDIYLRGLKAVADGNRRWARRAAHYGRATFPNKARRSPWYWGLRLITGAGPFGTLAMRAARQRLALRSEGTLSRRLQGPVGHVEE